MKEQFIYLMPTMAEALVAYSLIMCSALVLRLSSYSAVITLLGPLAAVTVMMLVYCASQKVSATTTLYSNVTYYHFYFPSVRSEGTIVLSRNNVASSSYSYGVVRVWYSNGWGNICDDSSFGYSEANVICHQLGYTGVSTYTRAGLTRYKQQ